METDKLKIDVNDLKKLIRDVEFIKNHLISEREEELSDWAKEELVEARKIPNSECISHEEVKKMILVK